MGNVWEFWDHNWYVRIMLNTGLWFVAYRARVIIYNEIL